MVERHGRLTCPQEGYSLNLAAEGLGLEDLRRRLAQVYEVRLKDPAECISAVEIIALPV